MMKNASPDAAVRQVMLLMPQVVARAKRLAVPAELQSFDLAPRHLTLLSCLLLDGPHTISELADLLEVAPTTVSLLVSRLNDQGVVVRDADPVDRRRRIVAIATAHRVAIEHWLAPGLQAWSQVMSDLAIDERALFVGTLRGYLSANGVGIAEHANPATK